MGGQISFCRRAFVRLWQRRAAIGMFGWRVSPTRLGQTRVDSTMEPQFETLLSGRCGGEHSGIVRVHQAFALQVSGPTNEVSGAVGHSGRRRSLC
jgi:hypothetical protein